MHAGLLSEAAVGRSDALSDDGTENESASATDAAVMQAQSAQREAMLVSQDSLNDSRKRLLEVREALQHDEREENERVEALQGETTGQAPRQHLCLTSRVSRHPYGAHLSCRVVLQLLQHCCCHL